MAQPLQLSAKRSIVLIQNSAEAPRGFPQSLEAKFGGIVFVLILSFELGCNEKFVSRAKNLFGNLLFLGHMFLVQLPPLWFLFKFNTIMTQISKPNHSK
jgi:hypothetical protein